MKRAEVVIIGGGAAGLTAAITAAGRGRSVVVCERLSQPGRKILATGGGRSNLLNESLDPVRFTTTDPSLPKAVFDRFGAAAIRGFFSGLGLELMNDGGRIYPVTNQAASVVKVLEMEIRRLGVGMEYGFEAVDVRAAGRTFQVRAEDGRTVEAPAVVLAGGGKSYPALGSNGSCYALASRLGHHIIAPVPSAVPLLVKDKLCHVLQGQKMKAGVRAEIGGRRAASAEGDLLFTQYGLSGTAVIDVSECLSIALNREHREDVEVVVDLVPSLKREELAARLRKRDGEGWPAADFFAGLLPEKVGRAMAGALSIGDRKKPLDPGVLADSLKSKRFTVHGTRGWNEAEFTSGGVDAREVDGRSLSSRLRVGLYLAGEVLDVQGPRGGYNLAWAWASGLLAGETVGVRS